MTNKVIYTIETRNIAGMVILYYPTEEVYHNIQSYLSELDCLYVVDNSSGESNEIVNKIKELSKVIYIPHINNAGIAFSINEVLNITKDKYSWLLTMDQDAGFISNGMSNYLSKINELADIDDIYAFCPLCCDEQLVEADGNFHVIDNAVTAGMIINIHKSLLCGGFREEFFIDEVDNEFCYRCNKKGYRLLQYREKLMKHVVGEHRGVHFLGKTYYIAAEKPERLYYMMRNGFYVMKDYPQKRWMYLSIRIRMLITIILFEENKWKKICYCFRGISDFLKGKIGKVYL